MGRFLRKIGRFYSSIIMGNVGVFIFIGLLSVIFQEQGWYPNEDIYEISQFVYRLILPVCIAYLGGEKTGGHTGGILAVLMTAGCLTYDTQAGILVGMIAAPVGGYAWKYGGENLKRRAGSSAQMLVGSLLVGVWGCILAAGGYYIMSPVLQMVSEVLGTCVNVMTEWNMLAALSIIVEPAKVLFLNNIVNHGILVPLGMEQLQKAGSSVLFLVEANAGPGLGLLTALFFAQRERREEHAASMIAQSAGGLHEVYFPEVLSDLWLLLPLIGAGAAGNLWFQLSGCGLKGPVSPGSIITILVMAGKENIVKIAIGIALSAAVSFTGSMIVLKIQTRRKNKENTENIENIDTMEIFAYGKEETEMPIHTIGFVCDAGVGSSVMGAALFRRKLAQNQICGVQVEAYACDQIPGKLDLIVCQKDFLRLIKDVSQDTEIFPVDSFMGGEAFEALIEMIHRRNR